MSGESHIETDEHGVQHSVIGASSMSRVEKCPKSVQYHKELLKTGWKGKSSVWAKKGTAVHALVEWALMNPKKALMGWQGKTHKDTGHVYTPVDINNVSWVRSVVSEIMSRPEWEGAELMVEKKLQLTSISEDAFGTTDIVLVIPFDKALILDYKDGTGKVETKGNRQLAYYGIGLQDEFVVNEIYAGILQPNISKKMDPIEVISESDLEDERVRLLATINRTEDPNEEPCKGSHCHWCPAKEAGVCPLHEKEEKQTTENLLLPTVVETEVEDDLSVNIRSLIAAKDLTPEQRSMVLMNMKAIEEWLESVYNYSLATFEESPTPNFMITEGREGNRKWNSDAEEELKKLGIKDSYLYDTKLTSPTNLEKRMGAEFGKVEHLVERAEAKKKLVAISESAGKLPKQRKTRGE
jgi:hypothetical protein